jgi:hypothetical protein
MPLSEHEESFLRKQIRDSTPMRPVNPMPPQNTFVPYLPDAKIEAWKSEPKLKPVDLNHDTAVEAKLKGAGFKGAPGEFYGTVGLNRQQILAMSANDIRAAIEAARNRDDFQPHRTTPAAPVVVAAPVRFAMTE